MVGDNANLQDVMIMMTLKSYKLNLESGEGIFASSSHSTADLLFFFFFFVPLVFFLFFIRTSFLKSLPSKSNVTFLVFNQMQIICL